MREIVEKRVRETKKDQKYNVLRECLQHLILKILDDTGSFQTLSFTGGTALRVLYDLRRFSEDMDFSLQQPQDPRFDFEKILHTLLSQLEMYHFKVDTKVKQVGAVKGVFFHFREILQDLKVVERKGQKLSIKLEVDSNPPLGAQFGTRIIQKDFLFSVVHHDLPTLFAGKLLAFLYRHYTKGRDVYDLIWYCSRKTPLNKIFFENGLVQSTGQNPSWTQEELIQKVSERVGQLNMTQIIQDVVPFLDDPAESRFFKEDLLQDLVKNIHFRSSS